jgi:hypothetical protein
MFSRDVLRFVAATRRVPAPLRAPLSAPNRTNTRKRSWQYASNTARGTGCGPTFTPHRQRDFGLLLGHEPGCPMVAYDLWQLTAIVRADAVVIRFRGSSYQM